MSIIYKAEVLSRLCKLSTKVTETQFKYTLPSDCFCGEKCSHHFQYDEEVILFIEQCVLNKLGE